MQDTLILLGAGEVHAHGTPDQLTALLSDFIAASLEFETIERTEKVFFPGYGGRPDREFWYAPLEAVYAATQPALGRHGLRVIQPPASASNGWCVKTMLIHRAGGILVSDLFIAETLNYWDKDAREWREKPRLPQDLGSELTYLKRYALCGMLGVNAEDDDDGAEASGSDAKREPRASPPGQQRPRNTPPPAQQRQQPPAQPPKKEPPPPKEQPKPEKPPEPEKPPAPPTEPAPPPVTEAPPPVPASEPPPPPAKDDSSWLDNTDGAAAAPNDDNEPVLPETSALMRNMLRTRGLTTREQLERLMQQVLSRGVSTAENPVTRGQARKLIAALEADPNLGRYAP